MATIIPCGHQLEKSEFPLSHSSFCTPCTWLSVIPSWLNTPAVLKRTSSPLTLYVSAATKDAPPLHIIFDCPLFQRAHDKARIDNDCFHPTIYNLSAPPKEPCVSQHPALSTYQWLTHRPWASYGHALGLLDWRLVSGFDCVGAPE